MKKFALILLAALLTVGLASLDAQAKRPGGGNVTKQHSTVTHKAEPPAPPQASAPAPAPAKGMLAGLVSGGVLASLLLGAVFFIFRMLRRKSAAESLQYVALGAETTPAMPARIFGSFLRPAPYPVGFEIEPFLRNAKASFTRLQAANDSADLDVIRDYTTPKMFVALKKQIEARSSDPRKTDIVTLDAEVLEVAIEDDLAVASVRFSGLLREKDFGGPAQPFYEIWNVQKRLHEPKSVWLLARIQQAHRIVHA
ncbi:MAG TPA: Tim44-like domain-containing protein [Burkholderiales bacterium]|nr:Tim44-like domain-containing protein [Burkholderiales bacterium]